MNWVMYAIWFGCGVMCGYQLHKVWWIRQQIKAIDELPQEYKDILKITMKGRKNGNNKHSK
jgi:hypothetical protein